MDCRPAARVGGLLAFSSDINSYRERFSEEIDEIFLALDMEPDAGRVRLINMVKISLILISGALFSTVICNSYILAGEKLMLTESDSTMNLFDFGDRTESSRWVVVNDNVMGGVSTGRVSLTKDSCLLFSGSLSLKNNGGFASIRTLPKDFHLGDYQGIRIQVKGDGKVYQFRIHVDDYFDAVAFKCDFQAADDIWTEIDLPFASFLPTYRGRILQNDNPLVAAKIRQMGFLIADKSAGPFNLIVDKITAYR